MYCTILEQKVDKEADMLRIGDKFFVQRKEVEK
jgi:hypothetical protein